MSDLIIIKCSATCKNGAGANGEGSSTKSTLDATNKAKNQLVIQCGFKGGVDESTVNCRAVET